MGDHQRPHQKFQRPGMGEAGCRVAEEPGADAGERQGDKERVKSPVADLRHHPQERRLLPRLRRHALHEPQTEPDQAENQHADTDIGVDVGRTHLFRRQRLAAEHQPRGSLHRIGEKQVEEDQRRHQPMQDTLRQGERESHFSAFSERLEQWHPVYGRLPEAQAKAASLSKI
jgi:hypothetical protein